MGLKKVDFTDPSTVMYYHTGNARFASTLTVSQRHTNPSCAYARYEKAPQPSLGN